MIKRSAFLSEVGIYLPETVLSISEVEDKIFASSPKSGYLRRGFITRLTGVEKVHYSSDTQDASDLAVLAVEDLARRLKIQVKDIQPDLLIFASASQDMIEPATAHIVAAKAGFTCPVMDVKNACNSVLNGIEIAQMFIESGKYGRVLVVSGETPTMGIRWNISSKKVFLESFPGFSMSDAGAAVLVDGRMGEVTERTSNILSSDFTAQSQAWDVGMFPGGGSAYPRDPDKMFFHISGDKLFKAFSALGTDFLTKTVAKNGHSWDDFKFIGIHQVSLPYLDTVMTSLGIPKNKEIITLREHGNMASCSLPLQLRLAVDSGKIVRGDAFALVGLAGGISMGMVVAQW